MEPRFRAVSYTKKTSSLPAWGEHQAKDGNDKKRRKKCLDKAIPNSISMDLVEEYPTRMPPQVLRKLTNVGFTVRCVRRIFINIVRIPIPKEGESVKAKLRTGISMGGWVSKHSIIRTRIE